MTNGWPSYDEPKTPEEYAAIERAICGAIGWISAGANEGNNSVYQETVKRLALAAAHFSKLASVPLKDDQEQT